MLWLLLGIMYERAINAIDCNGWTGSIGLNGWMGWNGLICSID